MKVPTEKKLHIFSLALLVLTLIPRFYDILKFLPDYSIDENEIVELAVAFMGGDFDPRWYKYGPLYAYILSFVYHIQALFHSGDFDGFVQDIFFNPTRFYYTARFINSCLNIMLALLTFKIARRYFQQKVAAIVLALAIFPFFDHLTNFTIRVDTLLAIWSMLTIYFSLRLFEAKQTKYYLLTGLFFGLGIATKPLPGILILPTIFLAHYFSLNEVVSLKGLIQAVRNRKIYVFLGCTLSGFIFNPYSLLNFKEFFKTQINAVLSEGSRKCTPGWDITRFFDDLGYAFVVLTVISIVYFVYNSIKLRNCVNLILLSYPVVFWLAFAKGAARDYFYVPIVPILIIFSSKIIFDISEKLKEKFRLHNILIYATLLLILFQPTRAAFSYSKRLNSRDYRTSHTSLVAKKWIEQNLAADSRIFLYGFYPLLPRLVDHRAEMQKKMGEYFQYHRDENEFLRTQFKKAHAKYLQEGKPTFYLERLRNDHLSEEGLLTYCQQQQIDYIVSHYDLTAYSGLESRVLKKFSRPLLGMKITIYKIQYFD